MEENTLVCNEDISSFSSSSSSSSSDSCIVNSKHSEQHELLNPSSKDDALRDLERLLNVETCHSQYCAQLRSQETISAARSNAVHWMIKVRNVYGFAPLTVALSVSYFDRYLSKELHRRVWKVWMIELLTVSCVSLAAKMEEPCVPMLPDLQIEGLEHLFESKTIQRMELTVMKLLDWRMSSVTCFSFVQGLLFGIEIPRNVRIVLVNRINELLLGTLLEAEFLGFAPSVVALCATLFALEEAVPLQADDHRRTLAKILPAEESMVQSCYKLMEEVVVDPLYPTHLVSSSQVLDVENGGRSAMVAGAAAGGGGGGAVASVAAAAAATAKSPVDVITAAGMAQLQQQQQQQVSKNDHWKSNNRGHDDGHEDGAPAKLNLCSTSTVTTTTTTTTTRTGKRKLEEFLCITR